MGEETEPEFRDHVEQQQEAFATALNALTEVRAYTLKAEELRDFKAAQYALRNLSEDHASEDVPDLYEVPITVTGDKRGDRP